MKKRSIGVSLFLLGILFIFGASWVAPWWTSPIWSNAPLEEFDGTIWAVYGLVFMAMSLAVPAGIIFLSLGILIISETGWKLIWILMFGVLIITFSFLNPATLNYYPIFFGILGGLILLFFFLVMWFWAKNHKGLDPKEKPASLFQFIGYVFFLLVAILMCSLLGNPMSGLFFPEKVIEYQSLPFYYSMGLKASIYMLIGWFFFFIATYKRARLRKRN